MNQRLSGKIRAKGREEGGRKDRKKQHREIAGKGTYLC